MLDKDADGTPNIVMVDAPEDEVSPAQNGSFNQFARNLTAEQMRIHFENELKAKLDAIPEFEIHEFADKKKNDKGEIVLDSNGYSVLVPVRVNKREYIEKTERARIEKVIAANSAPLTPEEIYHLNYLKKQHAAKQN